MGQTCGSCTSRKFKTNQETDGVVRSVCQASSWWSMDRKLSNPILLGHDLLLRPFVSCLWARGQLPGTLALGALETGGPGKSRQVVIWGRSAPSALSLVKYLSASSPLGLPPVSADRAVPHLHLSAASSLI